MNYNQIALKIETLNCKRLEDGLDLPASLLIGPDDYNTMKQHFFSFSQSPPTGYQAFSMVTTGGTMKIIHHPEIPTGIFVPVEPGESVADAYHHFYVGKIDHELNEIICKIIEEDE